MANVKDSADVQVKYLVKDLEAFLPDDLEMGENRFGKPIINKKISGFLWLIWLFLELQVATIGYNEVKVLKKEYFDKIRIAVENCERKTGRSITIIRDYM